MTNHTISKGLVAAALSVLCATPALAQLPNPSAASVGMANNYSVMARGFSAVSWNPAGLAMPGSPGFSLSFLPLRLTAGMDPVTLEDIAQYDDTIIPADVREEWLEAIIEEGSQQGSGGLGLSYLAFNVGRLGFQLGTTTNASANIGPDVARLLLFGNADGDTAITATGEGSEMTFGVVSTAAVSYAHPLTVRLGPLPDQHFALGATFKYSVGHFLMSGQDNGTTASADPLEVQVVFPTIISVAPDSLDGEEVEEGSAWNKGSGFGIDIGAMWSAGMFSASVSIQNLINTFAWNEDELWYSPGEAVFDADTTETNFDARPLSEAPEELRARLDDLAYPPMVAVGGAVRLPMVTVTAEVRHRPSESISLTEATHAGVGAEFRPVSFLPIRAGVAAISGGYNLGAGLGLEFGVFNLNVAGNRRSSELGTDYVGALTLSFGGI